MRFVFIFTLLGLFFLQFTEAQEVSCYEKMCDTEYARYKCHYCRSKRYYYEPICACKGSLSYTTKTKTKLRVYHTCIDGKHEPIYCYDTYCRVRPVCTYTPTTRFMRKRTYDCHKYYMPCRVYKRECYAPVVDECCDN